MSSIASTFSIDTASCAQKAAISYAWNLPRLAERLDMSEADLRDALYSIRASKSLNQLLLFLVKGDYAREHARVKAKVESYLQEQQQR